MTDLSILLAAGGAAIALLLLRLRALERRLDRLSRLDTKLDALLEHAGVEFDPYRDVPDDVREAIERGQTIIAIKRFRRATGVDLKEAKTSVDEIRRRVMGGAARP